MPRLNDEDIRNYLENLDDSEDVLDGSESESDEEDTYYQAARDVFRDLEGSDCEERHIGENIKSPSSNQLDDDIYYGNRSTFTRTDFIFTSPYKTYSLATTKSHY
ncbi:unnamed protein product [Parnassius apollo]|uniref:(apollo) hypothetical protein n=1 Tax=Parnassius apollo TaxID=110799 RepID=A0A8S3WWP9_PARAO|nr:unnamed protein product [Parnassius apollo]